MTSRFRTLLAACAALATALSVSATAAQTLYKLIDKDGKVTYSEKPPKDFQGKVIRMEIDPKANTATLPSGSRPETEAQRIIRRPTPDTPGRADPVRAAREKLEAAQKALQDATDNPREGEVRRMGNVGGGTRPVPTEDYQKRLDALQENVRKAEEELRLAQRNR
jgi:hypothetical protein